MTKNPYSQHFANRTIAQQYFRKFQDPIDLIRHEIEVEIIKPYANGLLLDCSVASGRFIKPFNNVQQYIGMDFSWEFLETLNLTRSDVLLLQGDLTSSIPIQNNSIDTLICIRTIFALPNTKEIINDFLRVVKSGGIICFDYGSKYRKIKLSEGDVESSNECIHEILSELPVDVVAEYGLDGILTSLKANRYIFYAVKKLSRYRAFKSLFFTIENITAKLYKGQRRLYIIKKS